MQHTEQEEINRSLIHIYRSQYKQSLMSEDIFAMSLIQPLLEGFSFLPFTNSAFRPFNLACVLNDILINERKTVLEFGSGISTIMMGRLIKKNDLDCKVISIDHDKEWMQVIQQYLDKEKTSEHITMLHAPLTASQYALDGNLWYNQDILEPVANDSNGFDMVLIDGPPAWEKHKEKSRYPAFPFIADKLHERAAVYLDDVNREGEKYIIQKIEDEYQVKFQYSGPTLAFIVRGKYFNPIPH